MWPWPSTLHAYLLFEAVWRVSLASITSVVLTNLVHAIVNWLGPSRTSVCYCGFQLHTRKQVEQPAREQAATSRKNKDSNTLRKTAITEQCVRELLVTDTEQILYKVKRKEVGQRLWTRLVLHAFWANLIFEF